MEKKRGPGEGGSCSGVFNVYQRVLSLLSSSEGPDAETTTPILWGMEGNKGGPRRWGGGGAEMGFEHATPMIPSSET